MESGRARRLGRTSVSVWTVVLWEIVAHLYIQKDHRSPLFQSPSFQPIRCNWGWEKAEWWMEMGPIFIT